MVQSTRKIATPFSGGGFDSVTTFPHREIISLTVVNATEELSWALLPKTGNPTPSEEPLRCDPQREFDLD